MRFLPQTTNIPLKSHCILVSLSIFCCYFHANYIYELGDCVPHPPSRATLHLQSSIFYPDSLCMSQPTNSCILSSLLLELPLFLMFVFSLSFNLHRFQKENQDMCLIPKKQCYWYLYIYILPIFK